MGRAPGAVATVIDSQSVKAADTVGKDSRGYDGAKKTSDAENRQAARDRWTSRGAGKAMSSLKCVRRVRQWWRQPIMRLNRLR